MIENLHDNKEFQQQKLQDDNSLIEEYIKELIRCDEQENLHTLLGVDYIIQEEMKKKEKKID